MAIVGVLVKYNPCSPYARLGKPCSGLGELPVCARSSGPCLDEKYDLWFKRAARGEIDNFYPKRIRLLEIPGTILILYHCQKRAIVGEAKIVRATFELGIHRYYFDRFIVYPNPISVSDGGLRRKFKSIPVSGKWWMKYVNEETLDAIRELSGLEIETKEKLKNDLEAIRNKTEKLPPFSKHSPFEMTRVLMEKETARLSASGMSPTVLDKTNQIFLRASKSKIYRGRSLKILFYAALFIACRSFRMTIKLEDVSKSEGINRKKLFSAFKFLRSEFGIALPRIDLRAWVKYYSKLLKLSTKTTKLAVELASRSLGNRNLKGRNPHSLAGTAIYVACLETHTNKKQQEISEITGVSTPTLRNLSKALLENAD